MSWKLKLATAGFAAAASVLVAQETPTTTTQSTEQTQTTRNPDGSTMTSTTAKSTTVTGEVLQYEPGKTIVIRDPNSKTVTYTLDGGLTVPADVQVGKKVTIYSSPVDGSVRVQRITTSTTANPDGSATSRTEVRDEPANAAAGQMGSTAAPAQTQTQPLPTDPAAADASMTTRTTKTTKTTTVSGTVQAYQPGQSITIVGPGNKTTVYTIVDDSKLPQDVAVGKQVTMQTTVVSGKPVVRSVTSRTTTVKTQTKAVSPQ